MNSLAAGSRGLPKYARVAARVRVLISEGVLLPGEPAPSGAELARVTGFSVLTCRRGLRVLVDEGVLVAGGSPSARPRVPGLVSSPGARAHAEAARALSASVAARRRALGLTQREFAALVGLSVTTIGHAETGRLWQSRDFWEKADKAVNADGELLAVHDCYRAASFPLAGPVVPGAVDGRAEVNGSAVSDAGDGLGPAGWLTPEERRAVREAGLLYAFIAEHVVLDGVTRAGDLAELRAAVHLIRRTVLAQAAARAYPDEFRLPGDVVRSAAGLVPRRFPRLAD